MTSKSGIASTLVLLALLALDMSFARFETAVLATLAMLIGAYWIGATAVERAGIVWRRPEFRSLVRVELPLILACAGFAVARGYVTFHEVFAIEGDPASRVEAGRLYDLLFGASVLAAELVLWRVHFITRVLAALGGRPPLLLAVTFSALILVGTVALCLPWSVREVEDVSLLDSLFTMTSAVCVTGLVVNDVGSHYTAFGQVVILLGIQAGGIGIMTIGAAALALRADVALRAQARYARVFETESLRDLRAIVRTVIGSTLVIELIGALVLYFLWVERSELEGRSAAWCAVFHAVSAFCNAGFALFPESLGRFTHDQGTQAVVMALIVLGGIGFPVYLELFRRARERIGAWRAGGRGVHHRLGVEARVVLSATAILIVLGAVLFAALEWNGAFRELSTVDSAFSALFASVTARTAGFSTVDLGTMRSTSWIVFMLLMWIGASPSSTGGGIKVSAAAVLFATLKGELRHHLPRLGLRTIGQETIRRASAVVLLSLVAFSLLTIGLTLTESLPPIELAFEAMSALTTTGLSTGITGRISDAGRILLVLGMFLGRLGPITVALAVGGARRGERFRLPEQELQVW